MLLTNLPVPSVPTSGALLPAGDPETGAPGAVRLGPAQVVFTARRHGDLADPSGNDPVVRNRQRAVVDRAWTVLRQVHGADVLVVERPGEAAGWPGDACVSAHPDVALAVLTADCAPVAFSSPEGVVGVAHAGWRGLVAGVIEETVRAMRELGARQVFATLGPCIHAECYAFGTDDLDRAASRLGDVVRGETAAGRPALDIPAGVRVAVQRAGADLAWDADVCTACSPDHWSWRARQERQRQGTVVWPV